MKETLKLRKWVWIVLFIALAFLVSAVLKTGLDKYNRIAEECDNHYGYTCSYYQVEQWSRGIQR